MWATNRAGDGTDGNGKKVNHQIYFQRTVSSSASSSFFVVSPSPLGLLLLAAFFSSLNPIRFHFSWLLLLLLCYNSATLMPGIHIQSDEFKVSGTIDGREIKANGQKRNSINDVNQFYCLDVGIGSG